MICKYHYSYNQIKYFKGGIIMSKTLALYFDQNQVVEIGIDETIIKMFKEQKKLEDRILNAEDPLEEMEKIEAETVEKIEDIEFINNGFAEWINSCENVIKISDLDKFDTTTTKSNSEILKNTTTIEDIINAEDVPDEIRRLADNDE